MRIIKTTLLTLLITASMSCFAQKPDNNKKQNITLQKAQTTKAAEVKKPDTTENLGLVKWLSFNEAMELNKKQPKAIIIDVYTDWCGWCKHMMKTTFSDAGIAQYINTHFYPIRFNAETKDTIEFQGQKYINKGTDKRSPHELAIKLLNGKLSYPTTLYMNNNFQLNLLVPGYLDSKKIEPFLVYSVENVFMSTNINDFLGCWDKAFNDTTKVKSKVAKDSIRWYTMNEALGMQKELPRKILVNISTQWCNNCKVMNNSTFKDSAMIKYINSNFYPVMIDAQSQELIVYKEKIYKMDETTKSPFNPFVMLLTGGRIVLPTIAFIDEKAEIITTAQFFNTAENLLPITKFIAEDKYKTMKWEDFRKEYDIKH